jgi:hypothetical protein
VESTAVVSKTLLEVDIDRDVDQLNNLITAYDSVKVIQSQITAESFNFIDKSNYVLYNEYIVSVTRNLGIKPVTISQETLATLPSVALTHHISLEGIIGDIWAKIKAMFGKIYDSIKQFFTTYFTRLGRVKKKLQNLVEVLNETNTDLKTISKDDVPSGIANKYPVNGQITINIVQEVFANVSAISSILTTVNNEALSLAKKEILDKNFVSNIKNLKDLAKDSQDKIDENNSKKGFNPLSKNNRDIRADNKSLKEIKEGATKEADGEENKAVDIGDNNIGLQFDDERFILAKKEFAELLKTIADEFNKIKGKMLVNGKVITKIELNEETGIQFESEENKETPSGISLGGKSELKSLISDTIKLIDSVEKVADSYSVVNDTIMKNIDTVDKLIKDIDAIKMETLGSYKTVLTKKVKERLNLMKAFFSNYNQVNKSLFGYVLDVADGNSEYALLSLKNFG